MTNNSKTLNSEIFTDAGVSKYLHDTIRYVNHISNCDIVYLLDNDLGGNKAPFIDAGTSSPYEVAMLARLYAFNEVFNKDVSTVYGNSISVNLLDNMKIEFTISKFCDIETAYQFLIKGHLNSAFTISDLYHLEVDYAENNICIIFNNIMSSRKIFDIFYRMAFYEARSCLAK